MKHTDLEHLETLLKGSENASNALAIAMDAEVFAMMMRATGSKLSKLAAATEAAHNAYYGAHALYLAARCEYLGRT